MVDPDFTVRHSGSIQLGLYFSEIGKRLHAEGKVIETDLFLIRVPGTTSSTVSEKKPGVPDLVHAAIRILLTRRSQERRVKPFASAWVSDSKDNVIHKLGISHGSACLAEWKMRKVSRENGQLQGRGR
jgi:hypothetical protein